MCSPSEAGEADSQEHLKVWIVKSILSGLCYVHSNGLVHGNISPLSVLCEDTSDMPNVILSEF
jgi:serine/threonine protein kinase